MTRLVRITAERFCAGVIFEKKTTVRGASRMWVAVETAPILRRWRGTSMKQMKQIALSRGWVWEVLR